MYKNKYILHTHINNVHNKERELFECSHCGKQLKSKYYLQKHINLKHSTPTTTTTNNETVDESKI